MRDSSWLARTSLCLVLGLLSAVCPRAQGGPIAGLERLEHLPADNPLAEEWIRAIYQDRQGFLWLGTINGVHRFDGYTLKAFRHDANHPRSLPNNFINEFFEDSQGVLWIATMGGLARLEDQEPTPEGSEIFVTADTAGVFTTFRHDPDDPLSLDSDFVSGVVEDRNGALWVSTSAGVNRFDRTTETFERFAVDPPDARSRGALTAFLSRSGALWFGSLGPTLQRFDHDSQTLERFPLTAAPDQTSVWKIIEDEEGHLWVGTEGGYICRFDPATGESKIFRLSSESLGYIIGLSLQPNGELWIGTDKQGLWVLDPTTGDHRSYRPVAGMPGSFKSLQISEIFRDHAGVTWIGTGVGLAKYNPKKERFTLYRPRPGDPRTLSSIQVIGLMEDSQGQLWVASSAGLDVLGTEGHVIRRYRHEPGNPNSLLDNSVITTLEDSAGDVWIATAQGLSRLDVERDTFTHIRPDPGNPQGLIDTVQCLLEVEPGELWIGGIGGLNRLDVASGRLDQFGERRTILDMVADPSGVLWLASYGHGLMRFDPETETLAIYRHEFENSTSPSSNLLATLHRDQAGTLWIGSLGGGLNRFEAETETFTHFREQDGLANDNITDILEDSNGNLWLATRRGLSRFHPETETWSTYTLNDGLQGSVFNSGTGVLSATGALLFGGTGGITRFRPEQLAGAAQPPKVAITDFLLLNRSTPFSARRSAEPGDALPHLVLDHRDDVFAFQFAALDLAQPSLNRYAYIMEGFQQDWVESDAGNRLAQFTNLDAGEYVFRVKAANADGVWSTEDAAVRITVLPPPWQTWWAYSLYALAAMGAGLSYLRSHRSALRNEQETAKQEREAAQRERLVSQRLREVDKLKDEFLANTSHELKTPLYGITGLAESLIEGATGELPEQTRTNLSMIVASGRRLSHLVNDLLDFSKLRHQSLELALRPVDLRSLAEVVLLLSRPLVGSKPLTLENQVPPGLPAVHADENRLQQILYNLIGNAIKFTESGSVTVAACLEGDKVLVRVADTGVGIPMAAQERIFNAFEQADASIERAYGGTGLGLAVTRQLVEAHGGDITVESTEGEGAVFSFSLPVAQQAPAVEGARPSSTELAPPPAPLATSIAPERVAAGPASPEEHAPDRAPSGSRVLVVDDEPVNLQVLKNYLAMEDFQLTLASSGEEALRLLGEQTFDLVLLDVMMPKLSGYEVCRTLRESHPLAELPVIFLTARAQDSDVITGIELGANDYLTKPISKDRLLARIRPHLSLLGVHRNLEDLVEEKMSEVKVLRGLLPICASCKKIRDEDGDWHNLELFIDRRSEAKFTHGLCPNCVENYLS